MIKKTTHINKESPKGSLSECKQCYCANGNKADKNNKCTTRGGANTYSANADKCQVNPDGVFEFYGGCIQGKSKLLYNKTCTDYYCKNIIPSPSPASPSPGPTPSPSPSPSPSPTPNPSPGSSPTTNCNKQGYCCTPTQSKWTYNSDKCVDEAKKSADLSKCDNCVSWVHKYYTFITIIVVILLIISLIAGYIVHK